MKTEDFGSWIISGIDPGYSAVKLGTRTQNCGTKNMKWKKFCLSAARNKIQSFEQNNNDGAEGQTAVQSS